MPKTKKYKPPRQLSLPIIYLVAWDHTVSERDRDSLGDLPSWVHVMGWLVEDTKLAYKITSWTNDGFMDDCNSITYSIPKSMLIYPIKYLYKPKKRRGKSK